MKLQTLLGEAALAVCATATAGPSRDELQVLLQNSTSDWFVIFPDLNKGVPMHSGPSTDAEIEVNNEKAEYDTTRESADLDALAYFKMRPDAIDAIQSMAIGHNHAFKHNLIGSAAQTYGQFFSGAVDDLYKQ